MANMNLNPLIESLSGRFGNVVFRRVNGETVMCRRPDRSATPPTEAQEAQRERFREASFYGKSVMADPTARDFYETVAEARKQPLFSVIVEDFLVAPTVKGIDAGAYTGATGDPIVVRAHDDVEVTAVTVTLYDGETELESGPATLDEWRWVYEAQTDVASGTDVTISARAVDRPGNEGELSVDVTTP